MSEDPGDHVSQSFVEEKDDDEHLALVSPQALGAMVKSEIEAQLAAAHRFPRSIKVFLKDALTLATDSVEVAQSCIYTLERRGEGGKKNLIVGPSVRLAEMAASAFGNMHSGLRIIDEAEKFITGQGIAWDLQKNNLVQLEVRRRITGRNNRRYSDDMVVMTGNAAASIAYRNAIFRVIPRSYISRIFETVRTVARGDAKTLTARRKDVLERLEKRGVSMDRVFARLEVKGTDDIGLEHLEILIGLGTSLASGEETIDDLFPMPGPTPAPAAPAEDGKKISFAGKKEPTNEGQKG